MKTKYYSFLLLNFFFIIGCALHCKAVSTDTIKAGSYVVNMGITPQTFGNGLKPYGLVYDLLKNYKVPVKWVINLTKSKDGIDFTHNGVDYRGGTFIIPFEYRTTAVNTTISSWESQGVSGNTTVSDFITDVYITLHHPPIWTLDQANGAVAVNFFNNAGIPSSAYGGSSSTNWKDPSLLSACDDIFVLPHADPTWATHNNLYYWNLNYKGNIWSGCHAVSVLENLTDPGNTIQLNFLSTSGLVNYTEHSNGSPPFLYNYSTDAVMQFMQTLDNATNNGSERVYLPKSGGGWRASTKLGVYDASQADVPSFSPGPAAVVSYGRAYGDNARGWVMYEGGHDLNRSSVAIAERVAAQRAFINFSLFSTSDKNAWFDIQLHNVQDVMMANQPVDFSFSVPPGVNLANYTIQWSSSCAGTFSPDAHQQSVSFMPSATNTACIITATLIDGCNREVFASKGTYISSVLPVRTVISGAYNSSIRSTTLYWTAFDNQTVHRFEIERSSNGSDFIKIGELLQSGRTTTASYSFTDPYPLHDQPYYRLKTVYESNASNHSNVVLLKSSEPASAIRMLSNPARGNISFCYFSDANDSILARIFDINGKVLTFGRYPVGKGWTTIYLNSPARTPAGIYLLQVITKGQTINEKVCVAGM